MEKVRFLFGETVKYKGSESYFYKELDKGTGLYYYEARYYNPSVGRFIQADTLIPDVYNPQSLNRYSYVLNNPLRYVDPSGNVFVVDDATAAVLIASLGAVAFYALIAYLPGAGTGSGKVYLPPPNEIIPSRIYLPSPFGNGGISIELPGQGIWAPVIDLPPVDYGNDPLQLDRSYLPNPYKATHGGPPSESLDKHKRAQQYIGDQEWKRLIG